MKLHRFGSFLAIALALALANVPIAQARHHYGRSPNAAQTRPDAGAETYAYVFHDAEITQVIDEVLGRGLKLTYRLDPGVTGKMSFSIEQRLTKAQLLAALEAALTQYDVVMLKQGDTLILKPRATAQIGAGVSQGRGPSAKLGYWKAECSHLRQCAVWGRFQMVEPFLGNLLMLCRIGSILLVLPV